MTIAKRGTGDWVVASETRSDTLYVVKLVAGQWSCSCPGNVHHGHCKHVDSVRATPPAPEPMRGPSARETANLFLAPRHRR